MVLMGEVTDSNDGDGDDSGGGSGIGGNCGHVVGSDSREGDGILMSLGKVIS